MISARAVREPVDRAGESKQAVLAFLFEQLKATEQGADARVRWGRRGRRRRRRKRRTASNKPDPQGLLLIHPHRKIHARCIWRETYILVCTSFTRAQPTLPTSVSASSTGSEKQHQGENSRKQAVEQAARIPSFGVGHFSSLNTAIVLTDEQPAHNSMI